MKINKLLASQIPRARIGKGINARDSRKTPLTDA